MYTIWEDVEKITSSFKGSYSNIFPLVEKSELHNEELHELTSSPGLKRMVHAMNEGGHGTWHEWERREMHTEFW
jgi:hypothetical protein